MTDLVSMPAAGIGGGLLQDETRNLDTTHYFPDLNTIIDAVAENFQVRKSGRGRATRSQTVGTEPKPRVIQRVDNTHPKSPETLDSHFATRTAVTLKTRKGTLRGSAKQQVEQAWNSSTVKKLTNHSESLVYN
jgi:hypothetical protein